MNKVKFVYMTDPHIMGKTIASRKDNYPETIKNKIREWFDLGDRLDCEFFVCGGDIFDSPYVSNKLALEIRTLLVDRLRGRNLYFVWGNHDMIAWNPNTVIRTPFGLLEKITENFIVLDRTPIVHKCRNGMSVELSGISSYSGLDRDSEELGGRERDYIVSHKEHPHIRVVHGYVSEKEILETIPHTLIDSFINLTVADFTLLAHEHTGFNTRYSDTGNIVVNPGALGRVFASTVELKRKPKFLIGTIYEDGSKEIEEEFCKAALSGELIFDIESIKQKNVLRAAREISKAAIREKVTEINVKEMSITDILNRYSDAVSKEVFDIAIGKIRECEEEETQ